MSKARVLCTVLLVFACAPAVAQASERSKLTVAFKPYRLGQDTNITATFEIWTTNGQLPAPPTEFELRFPTSLVFSTSGLGLATCHPAALEARGVEGCSPNAQIGQGSAQAEVPLGPEPVKEDTKVTLLKGPPQGEHIGILVYSDGRTPVVAENLFQGELRENASYGTLLETELPLIPSVPGAGDAVLSRMEVTIGPDGLTYYKHERGKIVGYHPRGFQVPEVCPPGGFQFGLSMQFADGVVVPATDTIPCPASHHRHRRAGR
jgi:hypothetical protein